MGTNSTESSDGQTAREERRRTYLKVVVGKLTKPGLSPVEDGRTLSEQCLTAIDDRGQFPPKLFILLATKSFHPYRQTLIGIRNRLSDENLGNVPLIGSSVSGCIFDGDVHESGALLICLASRFIDAKIAVGENAQQDIHDDPHKAAEHAVSQILDGLGIAADQDVDPLNNRYLFVFLPGFDETGASISYRAPEIFDELRTRTYAHIPMFGGVSSGGLERRIGSQFLNDSVYVKSIVSALVTSNVAMGVSVSHGLTPTNISYRVKSVKEGGRIITDFWEKSPGEAVAEIEQKGHNIFLFGQENAQGDPVVSPPEIKDDTIHLARAFDPDASVHVFAVDPKRMHDVSRSRIRLAMSRAGMKKERVAGMIAMACIARYRERDRIGLNVQSAIQSVKDTLPDATSVGCYLDGEIGMDDMGRPVLANWSISVALLADEIPDRAQMLLGFDALTAHAVLPEGEKSPTEQATEHILQRVDALGYPGALISLIQPHHDTEWIVGHKALGHRWSQAVLPLTRRELRGEDVLSIVARERRFRYVRDSRERGACCHPETVAAGAIISQCIIPLLDRDGRPLGLLQIDLGDMRESHSLGKQQMVVLNTLGAMAAGMLSRAMQAEELEISRRIDAAIEPCLDCESVKDAAQRFIEQLAGALRADAHIRVSIAGTQRLRLIAGLGRYYEEAMKARQDIDIADECPSAICVREARSVLVNDLNLDKQALRMRERFRDVPLGEALQNMGAFVDFPIGIADAPPMGLVNISSSVPWFFTESKLRYIKDIGRRLYVLLSRVEARARENQSRHMIGFLREITPQLSPEMDLYAALRQQAEHVKRASQAHKVSCYLWDGSEDRFVLRAQAGWVDGSRVDHAGYGKGEGMTGKIACETKARYIPDLKVFKQGRNEDVTGKYLIPMFGSPRPDNVGYEVICLPLSFRGESLGIVTLHRERLHAQEKSGFATTDADIMQEAAEALSTFVAALSLYDKAKWQWREAKRLAAVSQTLLDDVPFPALLNKLCATIADEYQLRSCVIYLRDSRSDSTHSLQPAAYAGAGAKASICAREHLSPDEDIVQRVCAACASRESRVNRTNVGASAVDRVCIPLKLGEQCIGVLDMQWRGAPVSSAEQLTPRHDLKYLEFLAAQVASAIAAHKLRGEREKSRVSAARAKRALDVMAVTLLQRLHRLTKAVQSLSSGVDRMQRRDLDAEQMDIVSDCEASIEDLSSVLEKTRSVGTQLANTAKSRDHLDRLLGEVVRAHDEEYKRAGIVVTRDLKELEADFDPQQMTEAFENVIENAIKVMPNGGRLDVSMRHNADTDVCEILIADTGPGMTPEERAAVSAGDQIGGRLSMGLFLTRLYCENHAGRMEIDSSPGAGSTVRLTIPLHDPEGLS